MCNPFVKITFTEKLGGKEKKSGEKEEAGGNFRQKTRTQTIEKV